MRKIESTIVADEVYRQIKMMIIDGSLEPGARVDRQALAEGLGVSMTPVNEAVARLVGERFLERKVGSARKSDGFFVPESQRDALVHFFEIRAGIEGIAARLCVERMLQGEDPETAAKICSFFSSYSFDSQALDADELQRYAIEDTNFHEAIITFSGNPIIEDIDRNLGFIHISKVKGLIRPPHETLPEHLAIIQAFISRDAVLAQSLMTQHLLKSRDVLLESLRRKTVI